MGLLDYIKANTPRATTPRVKPGTVIREGLLSPNQFNAPAANRFKDSLFGLAGVVPGVGDVASGVEAADLWNRGEKGNAGLAALGMLPFVPALGGMVKKADSGLLGDAVFYHGSPENKAWPPNEKMRFFSSDPEYASGYAGNKPGSTVYPVRIETHNPKIVFMKDKAKWGYSKEDFEKLRKEGYDSLIVAPTWNPVKDEFPSTSQIEEIIPLEPRQVKSLFQ